MYRPSKIDRFLLGLAHVLEIINWLVAVFAVLALAPTVVQRAFFTVFGFHDSWFTSIYGWSLNASGLGAVNEGQRVVFLLCSMLAGVLFAMACHYTAVLLSYTGPLFRHGSGSSPEHHNITPFTQANVRNIRHIANYLLAVGITQAVLEFSLGFFQEAIDESARIAPADGALELTQDYNPFPGIEGGNLAIVLILVAVLVFCIARMFEYGVKLQEADDELI